MSALQRGEKGVVSIPLMVAAKCERHYLASFSTAGSALGTMVLKQIATDNWSSVLAG